MQSPAQSGDPPAQTRQTLSHPPHPTSSRVGLGFARSEGACMKHSQAPARVRVLLTWSLPHQKLELGISRDATEQPQLPRKEIRALQTF